jgi:hypothetical protein
MSQTLYDRIRIQFERKAGSLKSDLDVGESGEEWARKLEALWKTYLDKAVRVPLSDGARVPLIGS